MNDKLRTFLLHTFQKGILRGYVLQVPPLCGISLTQNHPAWPFVLFPPLPYKEFIVSNYQTQ